MPPPSAASGEGRTPRQDGDDNRLLELFWTNAEAGFGYASMDSLDSKNLGLKNTSGAGAMFGLGAGVRLLIFALGVRARINDLANFSLWEIDGELGVHIPMKRWDPYFGFHGGYAFDGSLGSTVSSASGTNIHGGNGGMSFGADYYIFPALSAGLDLSGDFLFLTRPPDPLPGDFKLLPPHEQKVIKSDPLYKDTGDSLGFGMSLSMHIGVHL